SFDQDLEGVRSLGAVLVVAGFVLPQQGMGQCWAFIGFRGCKGLQPSRSGRTIRALIKTWRASGPSAPRGSLQASFCRNKASANVGALVSSGAARDCSPPG